MNTKIKGGAGEDLVARFLKNKGYIIVENNYLCRGGEIDIIAKDKDDYVFVEVKTRLEGENTEESALDAFSYTKQKRFIWAVNSYLSFKKIQNPYRIDLVIIFKRDDELRLKHFINYEIDEKVSRFLW